MIYAGTREKVDARRKAFIRKRRLEHRAVADSLEEAGDRLFSTPWALVWGCRRNATIAGRKATAL